ncbi:MAG: hypothetical protein IJ188_01095 [Clostridia bacterium]|nr:hypothetical protein [Clostridia bacterium]
MSEENKSPTNINNAQEEWLRRLKAIGVDLWGNGPSQQAREEAEQAVEKDFAAEAATAQPTVPAATGKKPEAPQPVTAKRPKLTIENLWITADETVDWTEALLRETARDGLTSPKLWSFYHRMAPKVLAGDTGAYAEVLTTINPLGDLTEYVSGMVLRTPGPDQLECIFECQPDDLEKYGRDYLGALSLRTARDLLAILPVSEVKITGNLEKEQKVKVTFHRHQLLKKKMAFLNPADFLEACGGEINED